LSRAPFEHEPLPGRVLFGTGRVAEVPAEVERLGARRALVVAGRSGADVAARLAERLGGGSLVGVVPHVPVEVAERARARAQGADCLVALGGGSAVGLAKAVALTAHLPIVAVPTTYAGSELTPIWGLGEGGRKTTGRDLAVLPRTVVYDPELTLSLPARASAASGLNALAHCVEALWTERTNALVAAVAEEGARTLAAALRRVVEVPGDLGARTDALRGAWLAGSALAAAGTGLHHKLCHVLGGLGLPHAEAHAVLLPHTAAFVLPAAPEAAERLRRALGADDPVAALVRLERDLGLPTSLAELGLTDDELDPAARLAAASAPPHPRPATQDDLRALLGRAFSGAPTH
jgi:maleylacetate reductase